MKMHFYQVMLKPLLPNIPHFGMPVGVACFPDAENGLTGSMVAIRMALATLPEADREKYEALPQHMGAIDVLQQK